MTSLKSIEPKIDEETLRSALRQHLRGHHNTPPILAEEVSIDSWQRRVDMLAIFRTRISAYEIKSDFDTMKRIKQQLKQDYRFFDRAILVTTQKMADKIPSDFDFSAAGVWVAKPGNTRIKFEEFAPTPYHFTREKTALAALLPKTYLERVLKQAGLKRVHGLTRAELITELDNASVKALRNAVINFFRDRYGPNHELYKRDLK